MSITITSNYAIGQRQPPAQGPLVYVYKLQTSRQPVYAAIIRASKPCYVISWDKFKIKFKWFYEHVPMTIEITEFSNVADAERFFKDLLRDHGITTDDRLRGTIMSPELRLQLESKKIISSYESKVREESAKAEFIGKNLLPGGDPKRLIGVVDPRMLVTMYPEVEEFREELRDKSNFAKYMMGNWEKPEITSSFQVHDVSAVLLMEKERLVRRRERLINDDLDPEIRAIVEAQIEQEKKDRTELAPIMEHMPGVFIIYGLNRHEALWIGMTVGGVRYIMRHPMYYAAQREALTGMSDFDPMTMEFIECDPARRISEDVRHDECQSLKVALIRTIKPKFVKRNTDRYYADRYFPHPSLCLHKLLATGWVPPSNTSIEELKGAQ